MQNKVSIQGFEGSFHQVAARQFFGEDISVECCSSFKKVVEQAETDCRAGVMAIENSIVGSILPNYNLLKNTDLLVIGEVYLQIRQHLLVNPGVTLEDIREVHSHHMALLQCTDFLNLYNWKMVETEDTALSARHVFQYKSKHIAAIAGSLAAELYGLKILQPDIHSLDNNYTRFLILQDRKLGINIDGADKASIYFQTENRKGCLAEILTLIAGNNINLSKLQSFPIPGSDWLYYFHVDLEFSDLDDFHRMIEVIDPVTQELRIYGIYKKGKKNNEIC